MGIQSQRGSIHAFDTEAWRWPSPRRLLINTDIRSPFVRLIGADGVCIVWLSERGTPLLTIEYLVPWHPPGQVFFVFGVRGDENLVEFLCVSCECYAGRLRHVTTYCGQHRNCSYDVLTFLREEARSWARTLMKPRSMRSMWQRPGKAFKRTLERSLSMCVLVPSGPM